MKLCRKCQQVQPLTRFRVIHSEYGDYITHTCNDCINESRRGRHAKPPFIGESPEYAAFVGVAY